MFYSERLASVLLQFGEYDLPVLKKLPGKKKENKGPEVLKKKNDRIVLFDSDTEGEEDNIEVSEKKKKKKNT